MMSKAKIKEQLNDIALEAWLVLPMPSSVVSVSEFMLIFLQMEHAGCTNKNKMMCIVWQCDLVIEKGYRV